MRFVRGSAYLLMQVLHLMQDVSLAAAPSFVNSSQEGREACLLAGVTVAK